VLNRATKFYSSNIHTHIEDLEEIGITKPGIALIADGGPDWSPKFLKNTIALGQFWTF
jgi:hypothetical protein